MHELRQIVPHAFARAGTTHVVVSFDRTWVRDRFGRLVPVYARVPFVTRPA